MPRYPYTCLNCSGRKDVFKPISRYDDPEICPDCGTEMSRDFIAKPPATLDKPFHKPIEMFSIAPETPQEMVDLRRKLPDTQFTRDLVPLARTRAEKKRLLSAVNFQELS